MKKDGEMGEARRAWKKAHPGFTGAIHDLIERSFDAGWEAAAEHEATLRKVIEGIPHGYKCSMWDGDESDSASCDCYRAEALAVLRGAKP